MRKLLKHFCEEYVIFPGGVNYINVNYTPSRLGRKQLFFYIFEVLPTLWTSEEKEEEYTN